MSSSPAPGPAWQPESPIDPAPDTVVAPPRIEYVRPMAAPSRAWGTGPSIGQSLAIVGLFLVGIVAGVGGFVALNPPPPAQPFPSLAGAPEPAEAHALAEALKANDAEGVANHVLPAIATSLSDALTPIVEVTEVTYLGTVERDGRDLAGYIVVGRDDQSQKRIVGFVVDVMNDAIVGINQ